MSRNTIRRWDDVNGITDSQEKMVAFLENVNDAYAILQLRHDEENAVELFSSMKELERMGRAPDVDHYEVVYTGSLPIRPQTQSQINLQLESIFESFNFMHPEDFTGHSLSVSDVVALKLDGQVTSYFVEPVGFTRLEDFIRRENYLKNAEMALEDDYGMIDGIVNNGKRDERPSVLEQLKSKEGPEFSTFSSGREERERE